MQPTSCSRLCCFGLLITSLLLICEVLLAYASDKECPDLWLKWEGSCYQVFRDDMSWDDAEVVCHKYGTSGHLASLHREEDLNMLASYLEPSDVSHVWIGLSDQDKDGNWVWSDGSEALFIPWREGEPDTSGVKLCVFLSRQDDFKKFRTDRCLYYVSYVCKFEP